MLLDFGGIDGDWQQTWKCLACGREIYIDARRQAEDDLIKERVSLEQGLITETRRRS
jgi:hypothetical protein